MNEGVIPANRLAEINGDDLPPSLHSHYSRFFTTTRQSAPLRRIGTFGLAVERIVWMAGGGVASQARSTETAIAAMLFVFLKPRGDC